MHIILANPRGFCAGVNMAIDVVHQLLDTCPDDTICVYHEIVHNVHVVNRFRERGVMFVEEISEVPDNSIVVFSAHGVSPKIRKEAAERNLTAIDATCPLVTKVHAEAIRYARRGWQIVLIGHANHQEIIGTYGEAPDSMQIVESPDDIPNLSIEDAEKTVYLTQTTLSVDDANVIINALKAAYPGIKSPPTEDICYATTNRQHAVRAIAPDCDLVLVVGSRSSSNSVRLTEISENSGTPAQLIDDVHEVQEEWFEGVENVMVTAGASAPEDLVNELVIYLVERYKGTVEQRTIDRETIEFGLPGSLKQAMRKRGIDPSGRRIIIDPEKELLGALEAHNIPIQITDLTVGATD